MHARLYTLKVMHLYIIQSDISGNFKIGRSKHPARRLKQLQTGNPNKLKVVLVLENQGHREKMLHNRINRWVQKKSKGEWFEFELIGYLPDDITEQLDLDVVNTWWES